MEKITYERAKNGIDKTLITKYRKLITTPSSLKFKDRLIASLLMSIFFLPIIYAVGVGFAKIGEDDPSDIHVISLGTAQAMSAVAGRYIVPLVYIAMIVLVLLSIFNLFSKKNLAHQMLFGSIYMMWFMVCLFVDTFSMLFGLTLGAFGTVGLILQSLLVVYLLFVSLKKQFSELKAPLFKTKPFQGWSFTTEVLLATVIIVTLLNHFTFKIGYSGFDPNLIELLTGWGAIGWAGLVIIFTRMLLKQTILTYYFAKYDDQFYRDLDFTDEEWYGKRKAKRIQKKREKKGEVK
ncbi:hypothetical protein LFYK43_12460 [Ligilactobacillus salitolerans]|uniref:Beta-carotene 15,15'-monooxygenase n=2 Tax=Ligilactobacillus salitolerans TaxID=1808352 RepID=A0A401ITG1_9LACO|nr:hypothetical protein LFYK43_12460 [Ligilactobacillus salitolerans]